MIDQAALMVWLFGGKIQKRIIIKKCTVFYMNFSTHTFLRKSAQTLIPLYLAKENVN